MPTLPILDKGPCEMVWGYGDSDAVYLGKTLGGVNLKFDTKDSDINEDQAGDAAVNAVMTGSTLLITAKFTRLTIDQLALLMHTIESGGVVNIENQIGCDEYALAKTLVIKPLCGNVISTDPATWTEIFKAYPVPSLDLTWDKDTQRIIPITFKCFVSQESGFLGDFGTIGMASGATEFGI